MGDINIEKIQNTFLDDVFIIPQDEIIYRVDYKGSRYYVKIVDGKPVLKPSVTSIISKYHSMSPYLLKWWCDLGWEKAKEKLEESSLYGTWMHILFVKLLLKYQIDLSDTGLVMELQIFMDKEGLIEFKYDRDQWFKNIRQDLIGFIQWVQDYQIKPIAIEMTLHGEHVSGTLDLICQATFKNQALMPVERIIITDWKSGRNDFYDDYIVQLDGYWELIIEKYPNLQVDEIWSYGCKDYRLPIGKTVTPYRFENQTNKLQRGRWKHYLDIYHYENPEIELKSKAEIIDTIINIETNVKDCIKEVNPLEFLEEENADQEQGS